MARRLAADDLDRLCDEMLFALNASWPRRSLTWRMSEEVWQARPPMQEDRTAPRGEVQNRAAWVLRYAEWRAATAAMAERLAIEWALTKRDFLRREPGDWR